ncbi:MAG: HAMP domain-containing sensor histidine kinase [Dehalogenimonas sp.]
MSWLKSVKFKLTLVYSTVLLAVLAVVVIVSWAMLSYGLLHNLQESLAADGEKARELVFQNGYNNLDASIADMEQTSDSRFFVYDIESRTVLGKSDSLPIIQSTLFNLPGWSGAGSQTMDSVDGHLRLYITPFDAAVAPGKLLVVARDTDYIHSSLDFYRNVLFAFIPVALAVAGSTGYFLAGHSMRQVKMIRTTAEGIDPAKMTERIPVKSNDELGQLSKTLNSAFDRIQGFITRQRRFAEDATHDLRAPLTNIKAQTELALEPNRSKTYYREALQSIQEDTLQMESLVDDLLTLASLDTEPSSDFCTSFDLSNLMEDVCDGWEGPCSQKGLHFSRDIQPEISITGEPLDFQRIADNLMENAVKNTSKGGITFSMKEADGIVTITVTDTGRGISPENIEKIFWRFYRVDREAEGNGLGLPIVQGIAEMYGGGVKVESETGKGSTFTVTLALKRRWE